MGRILCIGGPGVLSTSTLAALVERGDSVALLTHTNRFLEDVPPGVTILAGERDDLAAVASAVDAWRPDAVVDFVLFHPPQAAALIPILRGKMGQYVFVSTVDVYGYPLAKLPFAESDPWGPPNCEYAAHKAQCEAIFGAASGAELPLTIVRPAYSFGPRFILSFMGRGQGLSLLARLRDSRPVFVPGDGTTLIHAGCAADTGRMIAEVLGAPQALGQDYTVGQRTFMTQDEYVRMLARALGVEARIVHIPTDVVFAIDAPEVRESLLHDLTRFNVAFSVERFCTDFPAFRWVWDLDAWAAHAVAWNVDRGLLPRQDEVIFDDLLIAAFERSVAGMRVEVESSHC
jgi:nucleoside-diphosphate-sugar epimerase